MTHESHHHDELDPAGGYNPPNRDAQPDGSDQSNSHDQLHRASASLAHYAAALADRVEPTTAQEILEESNMSHTLHGSSASNSVNGAELPDRSDGSDASDGPVGSNNADPANRRRMMPTVLVAAAVALVILAGAIIVNLENSGDEQVIAAASDNDDNAPTTADSTSPAPENDQADTPSTGSAIALTTPVDVTVRGFLVQDPRGHDEICSFDAWVGEPCAGVQIIGADDPAQLEALSITNESPQGFVTAHGTLGVEGLWVHTIERTDDPRYGDDGAVDQGCLTVDCSLDADTISAAVADAVNAVAGKHPELSITSVDIGYAGESNEASASHVAVVIGVAKINTGVRDEFTSAVKSATEPLGPTSVTIRPWIEAAGDIAVSAIPNFYPSSGPILTAAGPSFGSMQALLVARLEFDAATGCATAVSGAGQSPSSTEDKRIHIMWPFGYTASLEDQTILNFDGKVVAHHGDQLELGGGHVPYRADESSTNSDPGSYVSVCGSPTDIFLTGGLPALDG